jgi:hypothetical protein
MLPQREMCRLVVRRGLVQYEADQLKLFLE